MVDLPKKKVGVIACSGEELPEGTVTRLAALRVLEQLRPGDTVTICLPLFLAGGEGDRTFARFYPTIAVDGCELRCAARATEMYSNKPAASIVIRDLAVENHLAPLAGRRRLNAAGLQAVDLAAERIAELADALLDKAGTQHQRWDRRAGELIEIPVAPADEPVVATCACGSGIPIQQVEIAGQAVTIVALPLIFQQLREAGKPPSEATLREAVETVKIYNFIPPEAEAAYAAALLREYTTYWNREVSP